MKILKPSWVSHEGKPIFSIDIHPDGSRFATGGQGDNSGKIVIWSMEPVRNESMEKNKNVPRLLCQIDNHLGCVNCVRWSHDGKYLASASDDKLVMIWNYRSGASSSVFGSSGKFENLESWKSSATLRGHGGDVLHVAWSEGDTWLASCSVDNTIIIWNAHKLPEQISTLRGHTGLIKGLSWDPISKFLASQSDDKTIRIWRTYDWLQEACIKEPFKECGGTTHILRLDWSPDGQYLVSAHAMNNSGPTAKIINRTSWTANMDFVGHRKAVTCVRFNPRIMKTFKKTEREDYMCCAIGSKDRSLSVWSAALKKRPVVVMHDLFENSVLDISWSSDGLELLACSWDGSVAYFSFDPKEIGQPQSKDIKIAMLENLYGKIEPEQSVSKDDILIESVHVLSAIYDTKTSTNLSINEYSTSNMNASFLHPSISMMSDGTNKSSSKQIECRTSDGRRRITPIFLESQFIPSDGPRPHRSTTDPTFSSTMESSSIVIEKSSHIHIPSDSSRDAFKDAETNKNTTATSSSLCNASVKLINTTATTNTSSAALILATNEARVSTVDLTSVVVAVKSVAINAGAGIDVTLSKKIVESISCDSLKNKKDEPRYTTLKKPGDAWQSEDEPIRKRDGRGRPSKRNVIDSPTITQNIPPVLNTPTVPKKKKVPTATLR